MKELTLRYVSGYSVCKLLKKVDCSDREDILKSNLEFLEHSSEFIFVNKNYSVESDFGNLVPPSDLFF